MTDSFQLSFPAHPLREALYDELHARPFPLVATPQQVSHLAFRVEPEQQAAAFELLAELCRRYSVHPPAAEAASYLEDLGAFSLRWERHLEFYSLTFLRPRPPEGEPFRHPVLELLPEDWLAQLPGEAVAAFHVVVAGEELAMEEPALVRWFEGQRLVQSQPNGGQAFLCTAFKLHSDGFGRFLIQNRGMDDYQTGRLLLRVVEIETYRLLAQLALPAARRMGPELNAMDRELAAILGEVQRQGSDEASRELLQGLSQLSARIETWRAETNNRFSAARAYHDLVETRLRNIREEAVAGHITLAEFLNRRLTPGLRTCQAVQDRMEDLSRRIERAGDLLRTRANLALQEQNKSQLAAMNRRSRLQFRLQETVEGLSVAAISYYLVGLLGYMLDGVPLSAWGVEKTTVLALLVPFTVLLVWWLTQRIKHRLIKEPASGE